MSETQTSQRQALETMLPTLIHALRTPLSGLAMGIEVAALRLRSHQDEAGFLEPMRNTLQEMSGTLDQLTRYVRLKEGQTVQVEIAPFFAEVVQHWQMAHPKARVLWDRSWDGPEHHRMTLDIDALPHAVGHLLDNASEAGGLVPIRLSLVQTDADALCLAVRDAGAPISADVLPRMTEPFFTTKHRRLGLGLAFVDLVARAHGGHIAVDTGATGSVVTLHLCGRDDEVRHHERAQTHEGD